MPELLLADPGGPLLLGSGTALQLAHRQNLMELKELRTRATVLSELLNSTFPSAFKSLHLVHDWLPWMKNTVTALMELDKPPGVHVYGQPWGAGGSTSCLPGG